MFEFSLNPTGEQQSRSCPTCSDTTQFAVVKPVGNAPREAERQTLLICDRCETLFMTVGATKRIGGLLLFVPFAALLIGGIVAAAYFVFTMITEVAFNGGFILISLLLFAGCGFGLVKVFKTLRQLFSPNAILPLNRDENRYIFEGDL